MRIGILLAFLMVTALAPRATAGVPFEIVIEDAVGDVERANGQIVNVTNADIVRFESRVVDGMVIQRVKMAARPIAPDDSILVRSWFHNSTNGSFHVVDMEIFGDAPEAENRFRPLVRDGGFFDLRPIEATYGIDGTAWVFEFSASVVENATCFDPGAFATSTPPPRTGRPQVFDQVYLRSARHCTTAPEPAVEKRDIPAIRVGVPTSTPASVTPAPGSESPTPGAALWAVLLVASLAALARSRRDR